MKKKYEDFKSHRYRTVKRYVFLLKVYIIIAKCEEMFALVRYGLPSQLCEFKYAIAFACYLVHKLGIDEWLVRLVQSMYKDVRSRVRVGDGYSEEFGVGVGVHQGSVLSPLLFIIVLEALSREFRTGCPWELLYADDLMISAESMEELLVKVQTWKTEMEKKGPTCEHGEDKDYGVWH